MARVNLDRARMSPARWGKRLVVWIVLPLVLFYVLMNWRVGAAVDRALEPLRGFAEVSRGKAFFAWNGDVGVERLEISPHDPQLGGRLASGRIAVHTPGLFWVLSNAVFGSDEPPSTLGVTIENLEVAGFDGSKAMTSWIGLVSASPFETQGCNEVSWTRVALSSMGIHDGTTRFSGGYEIRPGNLIAMTGSVSTDNSSSVEFTAEVRVSDAQMAFAGAAADATLTALKWTIKDAGFVRARNKYCSARNHTSQTEFVTKHTGGVRRLLLSEGLSPSLQVEESYKRFAAQGGEMLIQAHPIGPLRFADFARYSDADRLRMLNLTLTVSGMAPVAMAMDVVPLVPLPKERMTLEEQLEAERIAQRNAANTAVMPEATPASTGAIGASAATVPTTPSATASTTTAGVAPTPVAAGVRPATTPAVVPSVVASVPKPIPAPTQAPTTAAKPTTTTVVASSGTVTAPSALRVIDPGTMEQALKYEDLVRYVGQTITVRTVNETRRTGTLLKYTMAGLTLKLTPREGNIELSLPHNTVREVSAPFRIDEPFHTLPGVDGAKKN